MKGQATLLLCVALCLTACKRDTHPREIVGMWLGPRDAWVDRQEILRLRRDGSGMRDTVAVRVKGTAWDSSAITWKVTRNEDGRATLCINRQRLGDVKCGFVVLADTFFVHVVDRDSVKYDRVLPSGWNPPLRAEPAP